jgi:hypothetical protein
MNRLQLVQGQGAYVRANMKPQKLNVALARLRSDL